jgi:hypothetical protein
MPSPTRPAQFKYKSCRGVALVELALAVPVMITLVFVALQLSHSLRYSEVLSTASREAANAAFRDCASSNNAGACLSGPLGQVNSFLAGLLPEADVIISVYAMDAAGSVTRLGFTGASDNGARLQTPHRHFSRYSAAAVQAGISALRPDNRPVVISEVFYNFDPMVNTPLAGLNIMELYEKTIY